MKYTARGFAIYEELTDTYGNEVRVQESSAMSRDKRCWIFVNNPNVSQAVRDAMPAAHLDPKQAVKIAKALLKFAKDA